MPNTSDQLGKHANEVMDDLQDIGDAVKDAVQEKFAQMGNEAAEYVEQGRDKVHGLACACERFVSERPLRSVLIAAGVGWLLGRFWRRG